MGTSTMGKIYGNSKGNNWGNFKSIISATLIITYYQIP